MCVNMPRLVTGGYVNKKTICKKTTKGLENEKHSPVTQTGCAFLRGRILVDHHPRTSPAAIPIDSSCARRGCQWEGATHRKTPRNPDAALRHGFAAARSCRGAKFRAGSSRSYQRF